jgi:hypothetical protein
MPGRTQNPGHEHRQQWSPGRAIAAEFSATKQKGNEMKPWSIYIVNLGPVSCRSEEDAKAITEEWLRRYPNGQVHDYGELHLATKEAFFREPENIPLS